METREGREDVSSESTGRGTWPSPSDGARSKQSSAYHSTPLRALAMAATLVESYIFPHHIPRNVQQPPHPTISFPVAPSPLEVSAIQASTSESICHQHHDQHHSRSWPLSHPSTTPVSTTDTSLAFRVISTPTFLN